MQVHLCLSLANKLVAQPAGDLIPGVLLIPVSVCRQPDTSYLPRPTA